VITVVSEECVTWHIQRINSTVYRPKFSICSIKASGPGSCSRYSDSLRAGRSGDRIPVGGGRFSAPVHSGLGAQPASYKMDTWELPGVKLSRRGVDHPPIPSAEVKERVELYLYFPFGPSWPVRGWMLPLPFTCWLTCTNNKIRYYLLSPIVHIIFHS
jgi:hypothetical protein